MIHDQMLGILDKGETSELLSNRRKPKGTFAFSEYESDNLSITLEFSVPHKYTYEHIQYIV